MYRPMPLLLLLLAQCLVVGTTQASGSNAHGAHGALGPPIKPNEMQAGGLLLRGSDGLRAAPTLATDVEIEVNGLIGRTRVSQRFHNPTSDWVEAVYVFPLPENAAVDSMRMKIGERIIEGQIQERAKARATFEKAKSEGRKTSLVEQERPNIFTTSVANIGPGEEVEVVLSYQGELRYDQGRFSLRFPMVVGPRYIPGPSNVEEFSESGWAENGVEVPDADRITPPISDPADGRTQNVTIRVRIDAGFRLVDVESATHPVRVRAKRKDVFEVELAGGAVPADSDFVLRWRPVVGKAPGAALFYEQWGGERYALLMVLPPDPELAGTRRLSKETIFVIDTSGSMGGTSIRQARAALTHALRRMNPNDAFNVIRFDSTVERLHDGARPVSPSAIRDAVDWVSGLEARGGTEMLPALKAALAHGEERRAVRQIIFITDGAVGNESALLTVIKKDLGRSRLYTVGIGSAPNSHFMSKAAEFGRGTFTYIATPEEVAARMGELFAKLDSPVLHDLAIEWGAPGVEAWPRRIPDVYRGEPVLIAARLPAGVVGIGGAAGVIGAGAIAGQLRNAGGLRNVVLTGRRGHEDLRIELDVSGGSNHIGVARLWARRKITSLMDSLREGAEVARVSSEVAGLGILHHLVTRWTSLVAVDVTPTAPIDVVPDKRAIPSLLPKGWSLRKLFGFGGDDERSLRLKPSPRTRSGGPLQKQAKAAVASGQILVFNPTGTLPMGATPAALLLWVGSALLGGSGLLWGFGRRT